MDPLAHTLLGATLAETRIGRSTRLAVPALYIGANLPDVDAATYLLGDGDLALGFRRGWTHGILAMGVGPLLLAGLLIAWDSLRGPGDRAPVRRDRLLAVSYIAFLSHPVLDWMNTYGMRFLMPLDGRWFYGDSLFIVDPWIWMILGGAVLLARKGGRRDVVLWILLGAAATLVVTGPRGIVPTASKGIWIAGIGALAALRMTVSGRWRGDRPAVAGLALASIYVVLMVANGAAARATVRDDLRQRGLDVVDLMVGPMPADPFRWDVVAETPEAYHHGRFRWLAGSSLELRGEIPKPTLSPVIAAARRAPSIQGALGWMRFPFTVVEDAGDGYLVYFIDARYRRAAGTGFGSAVVRLDGDLRFVPP